jgi:hypothetical protein
MDISRDEALSLLRKWREDGRRMQASVFCQDGIASASTVGRIEEIVDDGSIIRIGAATVVKTIGKQIGLVFDLSKAEIIRLEDWRNAPPGDTEVLRQRFDGVMFVVFSDSHCELYAAKTKDELVGM